MTNGRYAARDAGCGARRFRGVPQGNPKIARPFQRREPANNIYKQVPAGRPKLRHVRQGREGMRVEDREWRMEDGARDIFQLRQERNICRKPTNHTYLPSPVRGDIFSSCSDAAPDGAKIIINWGVRVTTNMSRLRRFGPLFPLPRRSFLTKAGPWLMNS